MRIDPEFSTLLGDLYQGPLEDPPWQAFLGAVRRALGADLVTLLLRPPSLEEQSVMLADGGSLAAIRSYNEGQFVLDPFVDLPPGEVVSLHDVLSGERLLQSDFYRVIMAPQGWYDFLGVDIREEGALDARFRAGRRLGGEAFAGREKALLGDLLPHLERAIRLHARISRSEGERAVYAGAVDQLRVATIILDEQGRVLSTNEAANELLAGGNGIGLVDGRPRLSEPQAQAEFSRLLEELRQSRRGRSANPVAALQVPRDDDAPDLGLVARAVPAAGRAEGRGSPSIALFISDPGQAPETPQRVVSRLFDLTPAESALSLLLADGMSLDEAAGALAISRNTARAHLRAVFAKTGVTRQSGLVRLILRSVAPLAGVASS